MYHRSEADVEATLTNKLKSLIHDDILFNPNDTWSKTFSVADFVASSSSLKR